MAIGNQSVTVAGDRQMESHGFSTKNCTYTLMKEYMDSVLHVEMVDVQHSQLKSSVMERVGCERALDFLMRELSIQELVTDASSQLIKMLGEFSVIIDSNILNYCSNHKLVFFLRGQGLCSPGTPFELTLSPG